MINEWHLMHRYPANRLDVAWVAGLYCAWEVRNDNGVSMVRFRTLEGLINYARNYAGMVLPSIELESTMRAAGLLCVR